MLRYPRFPNPVEGAKCVWLFERSHEGLETASGIPLAGLGCAVVEAVVEQARCGRICVFRGAGGARDRFAHALPKSADRRAYAESYFSLAEGFGADELLAGRSAVAFLLLLPTDLAGAFGKLLLQRERRGHP